MSFSSALRHLLAMDYLNLELRAHTQHQWLDLFSCSALSMRCSGSDSRGSPMQIAVIIGDIVGKFTNDAIMHVMTRRKNGIFEAESRLW
jgi:hypothetical protein